MPPTSKNLLALGTACLTLAGCAETLIAPPRVGPVDLAQPWQTANAASLGVDDAGLGRAAERAERKAKAAAAKAAAKAKGE